MKLRNFVCFRYYRYFLILWGILTLWPTTGIVLGVMRCIEHPDDVSLNLLTLFVLVIFLWFFGEVIYYIVCILRLKKEKRYGGKIIPCSNVFVRTEREVETIYASIDGKSIALTPSIHARFYRLFVPWRLDRLNFCYQIGSKYYLLVDDKISNAMY